MMHSSASIASPASLDHHFSQLSAPPLFFTLPHQALGSPYPAGPTLHPPTPPIAHQQLQPSVSAGFRKNVVDNTHSRLSVARDLRASRRRKFPNLTYYRSVPSHVPCGPPFFRPATMASCKQPTTAYSQEIGENSNSVYKLLQCRDDSNMIRA